MLIVIEQVLLLLAFAAFGDSHCGGLRFAAAGADDTGAACHYVPGYAHQYEHHRFRKAGGTGLQAWCRNGIYFQHFVLSNHSFVFTFIRLLCTINTFFQQECDGFGYSFI